MKCIELMLKVQFKIELYFGFKPFIKRFSLDRLTDGNACLALEGGLILRVVGYL